MEEQVEFNSGKIRLEGLLESGYGARGVVLTHPHTLYGGDMYNPVVECLQKAYREHGFTTLRFNFRGAGKSSGVYDEGAGEQQDVMAALDFLGKQGVREIELTGYSFGAWVNAHALTHPDQARQTIMVSPPVAFMDFSGVPPQPALSLAVTGSRDEIAPAEEIRSMLSSWNPEAALEIIEGADHFYWSHLDALQGVLERQLASSAT